MAGRKAGRTTETPPQDELKSPTLSRRDFLAKGATAGAGLAAAALTSGAADSFAADPGLNGNRVPALEGDRPIRLSQDFTDSLAAAPRPASWEAVAEAIAQAGPNPGAANRRGGRRGAVAAPPQTIQPLQPQNPPAPPALSPEEALRQATLRAQGVLEQETFRSAEPSLNLRGAAGTPEVADVQPTRRELGLTSHQVFALACEQEDVGAFFCHPGAVGLVDAMAMQGIPSYGGRTEGGMCSAADGFCRATGEVAVCCGREGPGVAHMTVNIAQAHAARSPILVVASNRSFSADDTDAADHLYQQKQTEGIRKYGKRMISANRLHEYAAYAFRALKTGVPGPVHLDFPTEATGGIFTDPAGLQLFATRDRYRVERKPSPQPSDLAAAVAMIATAQRPMIVAGAGVFYDKAWESLRLAAEKNDIPVVETGPVRGHFSDGHRLSAAFAAGALGSVDLVIFVGQYLMPRMGAIDGWRFGPDVKTIRVHPVAEDIGRNWPVDIGIVSGEDNFFLTLADALPRRSRDAWVAEIEAARVAFETENEGYYRLGLQHSAAANCVHPAVIAREMQDVLYNGAVPKEQTVVAIGGYMMARYARRYLRAYRPGQLIQSAYNYDANGPEICHAFGAGVAVQLGAGPQAPYKGAPVVCLTSDTGMGFYGFEIETFAKYKIPAVVVVYNNNATGMWSISRPPSRHMGLFQENLRYDKVAEGLGARGVYVTQAARFKDEFRTAYDLAAGNRTTTLLNVQAIKEFSGNAYSPGFLNFSSPGAGNHWK